MRERLPIALVLVFAIFLLTSCRVVDNPPPVTRDPLPIETPPIGKSLSVPGIPGLYLAWGSAVNAVPPTREPGDPLAPGNQLLGVDCISYLGLGGDVGATGVWNTRNAINWSPYDNCLKQAAAARVKLPDGQVIPQPVILTVPSGFSDIGSQWYRTSGHGEPGTADNPFMRLHLPSWMQNDTYRFTFTAPSGKVYQSVRYGGEFKKRMIEFIEAAGQRYNSNPQVAAVRVYVGVQGESQPVVQCQPYWDVVPPAGRDSVNCGSDTLATVMAEHEKTVSCTEYTAFVRDLTEAALRAFPDKAILSMGDTGPCSTMSGKSFRKWLYEVQWAGKPIGLSMNNINVDRPDVDERPGNSLTAWNKWTFGRVLRDLGYPMLYEFDAHMPSVEGMYWTVLSAAGNGGNFVLYHSPWNGSFSQPMWEVVDYWLGSERRAWLVFRDREYPTYDFTKGYGTSGSLGDWAKYLRVLNAEDAPQACSPNLLKNARSANATAVASGGINLTPACPESLPTPAVTPAPTPSPGPDLLNRLLDRQARRLDPEKVLRVAVSGDWPAFGTIGPIQITVSYLDTGKDGFEVVLPGANGRPARYTIQKTGAGIWKQATWIENVSIGNVLDGDNFVQIINDAEGAEYLHEIHLTVAESALTPTATATTTPSPRPTIATLTATSTVPPTATSMQNPTSIPTPTWTATRTPTATNSPSVIPALTATPTVATATPRPTATGNVVRTSTPAPTVVPTMAASPLPASACAPRALGSLALNGPRALAAGPDGFYAALFDSSEVVAFSGDTRVRAWQTLSGPGRTNGLAVWGDTLVATNRDAGTVTLHRAGTGEQLAVIPVESLPWGISVGPGTAGTGVAYVANFGDDSITVIDLAGRKQLVTVPVDPVPVTALVADGHVFVLHLDGVLTRLDPAGKVLGQSSSGLADTRGIAFDPLRKRLYVGSESGSIVALNLSTLTSVARYSLPGSAYAVAVNEGTGRIFTVDAQGDRLFVVDPDSGAVDVLPLLDQGDAQGGQGLAVQGNRIVVSNYASNSVSFFDDSTCVDRLTPAAGSQVGATMTPTATLTRTSVPTFTTAPTHTFTPRPSATFTATATATATATRTATATSTPTPITIRAKVEIVWPHGGAGVQDADLANVTAYLLLGDGTQGARTLLDSVACDWEPTVRLWSALNNQAARLVGIGQKRMVTGGGRNFPAWDFNDVDVRQARDPANKVSFYLTVESASSPVLTLRNVWVHAVDARTLFPQQDVPTSVTRVWPSAVDAKIQIVWPHENLPVQQAKRANITAYLFATGTQQALSPDIASTAAWSAMVRLHRSVNNEPEVAGATAGGDILGVPRVITGANGVKFLAWDFNDVDVSLANDPLNRLYFWVSVDRVPTYSNVWAHGADARTLFPQPDVLNSCR